MTQTERSAGGWVARGWAWARACRARRPEYRIAAYVFLRGLAVIYAIAIISLWTQIQGLVGQEGILPVAPFLHDVQSQIGVRGYWEFPTLCWLNSSDGALNALCGAGVGAAAALFMGLLPATSALALWIIYLSLTTVGRTFLGFQWDNLLLETGFLAIFVAPWTWRSRLGRDPHPPRLVLYLMNWLVFRFMLSSGVVKLTSGDPSWRDGTALTYHYLTTCIPNPLAWYADKMPLGFHKASCVVMFFIELVVPWLIFGPRQGRRAACAAFVLLQVIIMATGNYGYFNLLSILIFVPLLDDACWPKVLRSRLESQEPHRGRNWPRVVTSIVAALVLLVSSIVLTVTLRLHVRWPTWTLSVYETVQPLRSINGYGLFASMTKHRPEIVIEGSMDGNTWYAYEFRYKPGDVTRAPPWVAPHQPRLDWQMWFAALGNYEGNPWLVNLMIRLLQDSPTVTPLLAYNPFPAEPPVYIRAVTYDYHYTTREERKLTGAWWKREYRGVYCPPIRINNPGDT